MITIFEKFSNLILSDLVHGDFNVKLIIDNNKKNFYVENILIVSINKKIVIYNQNIIDLVSHYITLTPNQENHIYTINIKNPTKGNVKKLIRQYLEDLLYIDATPVELTKYSYLDFRKPYKKIKNNGFDINRIREYIHEINNYIEKYKTMNILDYEKYNNTIKKFEEDLINLKEFDIKRIYKDIDIIRLFLINMYSTAKTHHYNKVLKTVQKLKKHMLLYLEKK